MTETRKIGKTVFADLWYPKCDGPDSVDMIEIELVDVRAADALRVRFSHERDGYVISMDKTRTEDGVSIVVEEDVEVAFVPAWNEVVA